MKKLIAIILIVVGLLEIFGFTAALLLLKNKLEDFRLVGEQFGNTFLRNYAFTRSDQKEVNDKQWKHLAEMAQQADILKEQYEAIDAASDVMNERYLVISDNYKKLLDAWEKVEERYSDCYEQLKYQNEQFERLEKFYLEPSSCSVQITETDDGHEIMKCPMMSIDIPPEWNEYFEPMKEMAKR